MNQSIFEILDINSREDSYTSLISCTFNYSETFRNNLLNELNLKPSCDWNSHLKPSINFKHKNRKKLIPDLILTSKIEQSIILIEVKIFSLEGKNQTNLYSSHDFQIAVCNHFEIPDSKIKFYYLTLRGDKAQSKSFNNISFQNILYCIPEKLDNSKYPYPFLLKELHIRLKEYYNLSISNLEVKALEFFSYQRNLIDQFQLFKIGMKSLESENDYTYIYDQTNNVGDGVTYLVYWFKKNWHGINISLDKKGSDTFEIHFEFHWHTQNRENPLCLYLHYHTHPYQTKNQLQRLMDAEKINSDFKDHYNNRRNQFYNNLKSSVISSHWTFKKTYLRLAHKKFHSDITFIELKSQITTLCKEIDPLIDSFVYTD